MAFATTLAGITSRYRDTLSLFDPGCLQIPINSEQLRAPVLEGDARMGCRIESYERK